MATFPLREVNYKTLRNDLPVPINPPSESSDEPPEIDHDDTTDVIIHKVPQSTGKIGQWTHIEDLDSFFTRMYNYYVTGGFYPMFIAEILNLVQMIFVAWFSTFLSHCVNYDKLFRRDPSVNITEKMTISDVVLDSNECVANIGWEWWFLLVICLSMWLLRAVKAAYTLYYAYDTKQFYNHALKIEDKDLTWVNWSTVLRKCREAQTEERMCVHKREINELDIYHRILRFDNYLVAMVNKNILPLSIFIPFLGEVPYLSRGLKFNLEIILFFWPLSPWENHWQLQEGYKDIMNRLALAREMEKRIFVLAMLNVLLLPAILTWQLVYSFLNNVEQVMKRSPNTFGLRVWSPYARIALRHFNELDHELQDRLGRAYKPATKYLASFPSPAVSVIAKHIRFCCGSIFGVLIMLTLYDEDVLAVEHVLSIITLLGFVTACTSVFLIEEDGRYMTGATVSEELLVQVLSHVHYLPADWRGKAHTAFVADRLQKLFQYRAMYIVLELLSPIFTPLILLKCRKRAIDIIDFYRNFTVSVVGIGDVCSFAQLDVCRHGHPDWQTPVFNTEPKRKRGTQYEQCERGKTELSLVAFSTRNPCWRPEREQQLFLKSLKQSVREASSELHPLANNITKTMMGSFVQQSAHGSLAAGQALLSHGQQREARMPNMDETSDEDEDSLQREKLPAYGGSTGVASLDPFAYTRPDQTNNMSISALHLYDIHIQQVQQSQQSMRESRSEPSRAGDCPASVLPRSSYRSTEATPLLHKT